jgi:PemK-like, MazF-like toxin of type II toxin-antitoxin system
MARKIIHPLRGEVWLVDFDPTIGAEITKTRPTPVIQNNIGNRASPIENPILPQIKIRYTQINSEKIIKNSL